MLPGGPVLLLIGLAAVGLLLLVLLWRWLARARPGKTWIVVDGSNVMYWQDNPAGKEPVRQVVADVKRQGYATGWSGFGGLSLP